MTDVALLAASGDADLGDKLARALAPAGFAVTPLGLPVPALGPVLVLWTSASVLDAEILKNARTARLAGRLLQVASRRGLSPNEFASDGYIDLSSWRGGGQHPRFRALVDALVAMRDGTPIPPAVGHRPQRSVVRVAVRVLMALGTLGFGTLGVLANVGGARDFLCSYNKEFCRSLGLFPSEPPTALTPLRGAIAHRWGTPGCKRVGQFSVDGDELHQRWKDFNSAARIDGEGSDTLFVTDTGTGERYALTVRARHLAIHKEGERHAMTELVRCDP